jgi:hypothetical protein
VRDRRLAERMRGVCLRIARRAGHAAERGLAATATKYALYNHRELVPRGKPPAIAAGARPIAVARRAVR